MQANDSEPRTGVIVVDPGNGAHRALAAALPGFRVVPAGAVVGRDVRCSAWLCVPDPALFSELVHVRELLMQRRGATVAVVGLAGDEPSGERLAALRRYAGAVVAVEASGATPPWAARLLAPVRAVDAPDVPAAVLAACAGPAEARGDVGDWLRDSQAFVARGDHEGAFQAAARALSMAPDQPGVLADVARLLALMGRAAQGRDLCQAYLLQRPDCAPVQRALADLQPAS